MSNLFSASTEIRCPICADGVSHSRRALFIRHCVTSKHLENYYNGRILGDNRKIQEYEELASSIEIDKGVNAYLDSDKSGTRRQNFTELQSQFSIGLQKWQPLSNNQDFQSEYAIQDGTLMQEEFPK